MSTHRWMDRVCVAAIVFALVLTVVFVNGEQFGIQRADKAMGYENRLFDTSQVHAIDIVMDDWDGFIETCENEEYAACTVVIDGESYSNVGIRAKGNTSLRNVSAMDSDRYSFKVEFDQYNSGNSYHGLDKLTLNNLIQDNTMMKDYLVYRMMDEFGVVSPLCSYAYITVNGEDWGLYLAVESIEESFLQRNYGSNYGELYKPDSMEMGGGEGSQDGFAPDGQPSVQTTENSRAEQVSLTDETPPAAEHNAATEQEGTSRSDAMAGQPPEGGFGTMGEMPEEANGETPSIPDESAFGNTPADVQTAESADRAGGELTAPDESAENSEWTIENFRGGGGKFGGGMGSEDVKLQYIDDDPSSYTNIFNNAKTDVTEADQQRLIASLKALSEKEDIESVVHVEDVIRYFVVHNYVVNGDSYTGSMVHNYYLYEEDGQLSMLPWDYNLAFGTFQGGSANDAVNQSIDSPVSGGDLDDRPMIAWIFADESYTALYHQYIGEFLETVDIAAMIQEVQALIAPYVESDPSKFCTTEEFEAGVSALQTFVQMRSESVSRQLSGDSTPVDTSSLTLSDMGSMGMDDRAGMMQISAEQPAADDADVQAQQDRGKQPPDTAEEGMPAPDQSAMPERIPSATETQMFAQPNADMGSPQPSAGHSTAQPSADLWMVLAVSILVLLVGLVVAARFKR